MTWSRFCEAEVVLTTANATDRHGLVGNQRRSDRAECEQFSPSRQFYTPTCDEGPKVLDVPCRGVPFRAENEARPPVDVVVAWSFEAGLKSGAGSCAVGRHVCLEHGD